MNNEPIDSVFKCPPPSSAFDFATNPSWRIFRIMAEFIDGFEFLSKFDKSVTFWGSARLTPEIHHYNDAQKLAELLAKDGFSIVTGGGPGIMEAANRGAALAKGDSVGLNIQLPTEQRTNLFVKDGFSIVTGGGPGIMEAANRGAALAKGDSLGLNIQLPTEQRTNPFVKRGMGFHYFFTRKVMLSAASQAYVYFPGGFWTLDEVFEIATLIQTKKMERVPMIAMGSHYWAPLFEWLKKEAIKDHALIDEADLNIWHLTDSVEEAFEIIKKSKPRVQF